MFTLGIEEEYQLIDPVTKELSPSIYDILEEGQKIFGKRIIVETHQSMVELVTPVCANIEQARSELLYMRSALHKLVSKHNKVFLAASTHPFSDWKDQNMSNDERRRGLEEDFQDVARRLVIYGLHIHVAIPDPASRIYIMNAVRHFLPYLLALSASSPFWQGRNTGLKSYRVEVWKAFPRTGIPDVFQSKKEYEDLVDTLIKTNCIDNPRKLWWDVRLHPIFPTIECRICDIPSKIEDTIAIAALFQALIAKLYKQRNSSNPVKSYCSALILENKWRATRYGLDGLFIDLEKQIEVQTRQLIHNVLEFVDDVVDELGSRKYIEHIYTILEKGTSADRQLKTYNQTKNFHDVVDQLISETLEKI